MGDECLRRRGSIEKVRRERAFLPSDQTGRPWTSIRPRSMRTVPFLRSRPTSSGRAARCDVIRTGGPDGSARPNGARRSSAGTAATSSSVHALISSSRSGLATSRGMPTRSAGLRRSSPVATASASAARSTMRKMMDAAPGEVTAGRQALETAGHVLAGRGGRHESPRERVGSASPPTRTASATWPRRGRRPATQLSTSSPTVP